ncbi:hypothetical protein [Kocuria rosea]|uniref:hypothetical protein n=1 Tax=Kocuria rosea TaxID=1275 RepID=UPI0011A22E0D|nr:hypothetical protein [Kocuria rosea]
MKGTVTCFVQALMALLLIAGIVSGPVAPAHAEGIGGKTDATSGGTGSGTGDVVGVGSPPGSDVPNPGDLGGLTDFDSLRGNAVIWNYDYRSTEKCPQGVVEKHVLQSDGRTYKITERKCIGGEPAYEIRLYKNYCAASSTVSIERMRPDMKELFSQTRSTRWGGGDRTIAGCDASSKISFGKILIPLEIGHYRSDGGSQLDLLYVKHYTEKTADGRTLKDRFHSWKPAKKVNTFTNYATLRCTNGNPDWVASLVSYQGQDSCGGDLAELTEPPTSSTPSATPPAALAQCKVPGPARLRGLTGQVDLMRDGSDQSIRWTGGQGTPTITGKGVTDVKGVSTRFEVFNAPRLERAGSSFAGNLFELETTKGKDLLRKEWKADSKGFGETPETSGIVTDSTVRFFKSVDRDKPTVITPVWTFSAMVETPTISLKDIDPFTGKVTTEKVMVKKQTEVECRGGAIRANVLKTMNDNIKG